MNPSAGSSYGFRRSLGIAVWLGLASLSLHIGCDAEKLAEEASLPDVYLLVVDTLRADHLGLYGYARRTSPALDRFSDSAIVFEEVFAPSSWTLPSIGSIMTGTYPSIHGLRLAEPEGSLSTMRPGAISLAVILRQAGYRTVAVVTNSWIAQKHGLLRGFDQFELHDMADAAQVNSLARDIIARRAGEPLFVYLHYMDVHGPYRVTGSPASLGQPPEGNRRPLSSDEVDRLPDYLQLPEARDLGAYVEGYDQGIAYWDSQFGSFVDWLRREGHLERAIVAVLSDHGEELLEHGGWNHGQTLYQEQLAVPWILRIPGGSGARVRDRVVSLIDTAPTILAVLGLDAPSSMLGRDALDPVGGRQRTLFAETRVALGGGPGRVLRAARRGERKLIDIAEERRCFDLGEDPGELSPVTSGPTCTDLARLDSWIAEANELGAELGDSESHALDAAERERLRTLGYLP